MAAVGFEREDTTSNSDPYAGGDSNQPPSQSETKSETIYTFESLRKRDTSTFLTEQPNSDNVCNKSKSMECSISEMLQGGIIAALILAILTVIMWVYILVELNINMPRGFGWITLLYPFGSMYEHQSCGMDRKLCPISNSFSLPYVPVVGIFLAAIQILNTVAFLGWNTCRKTFLFYLKETAFLHILFLVFQGIISGSAVHNGLAGLASRMKMEMARVPSDRWDHVQLSHKCCGINGVKDWEAYNNTIPKSCHMSQRCSLSAQSFCVYWPRGCYDVEKDIIVKMTKLGTVALIGGAIISVLVFVMGKFYLLAVKKLQKFDDTPSHRILIRQGSKCTAFGGKGRHSHVIRKDGILIEVKGALASSTGVNENVVALTIVDCSKADKVSTTKELDRIVVTVTKHGIVRGKALISAQNDSDLQHVDVRPTQFGIMIVVDECVEQ